MKFLRKNTDSPILAEKLTYQGSGHNDRLRALLLEEQFANRVRYVPGEFVYEEVERDDEAAALIDYLGFNDASVCSARRNHVRRIMGLVEDAGVDLVLDQFRKSAEELSFPTALEAELHLDLSELLGSVSRS